MKKGTAAALILAALALILIVVVVVNSHTTRENENQAIYESVKAYEDRYCEGVYVDGIHLGGMTREEAETRLASKELGCRFIGSGKTVTDQTPVGGAIIPVGAQVVLYCGEVKPDDLCTVPNVMGMTAAQANKALTNAGLIMKVTGANNKGAVYAINQSVAAEKQVKAGTVVTVQFGDTSLLD